MLREVKCLFVIYVFRVGFAIYFHYSLSFLFQTYLFPDELTLYIGSLIKSMAKPNNAIADSHLRESFQLALSILLLSPFI